jgi:hypothetical protein
MFKANLVFACKLEMGPLQERMSEPEPVILE